jgi:delta14-sterol reductase
VSPARGRRLNASPGPAAAVSPAPAAKEKTPTRVRAASPAAGGRAKKSGGNATVHFEFGGPLGAAAITLGLPCVCYALVRFCHASGCLRLAPLRVPPSLPAGAYASFTGVAAFLAWLALCLGLHLLLPGARVQGTLLRNGQRLAYKLNGVHTCDRHTPKPLRRA